LHGIQVLEQMTKHAADGTVSASSEGSQKLQYLLKAESYTM
jgi:hypothetical protein